MVSFTDQLALLELERDPATRNATALQLAETRRPEVLTALLRLIKRADLADSRATLVHCLRFFDYSAHFELLIQLVAEGNWEVSHEAHSLLSSIQVLKGEEVLRAYKLLNELNNNDAIDDWRRDLLRDLLTMFE